MLDTRDQYVLALVGMKHADAERVPDSSIRGKTWLQKIIYVASKSCSDIGYDFTPHKYGMYSQMLDDSLEHCFHAGLVCIHRPDGVIHMTERGYGDLDITGCDGNMLRPLQSTKSLLNCLDYREMVVYSYALFPEMLEHSDIANDFESWRVDAATSMYLKGSVSFALAARISDLGQDGFAKHLQDGGIEPHATLVRTRVVVPTEAPTF